MMRAAIPSSSSPPHLGGGAILRAVFYAISFAATLGNVFALEETSERDLRKQSSLSNSSGKMSSSSGKMSSSNSSDGCIPISPTFSPTKSSKGSKTSKGRKGYMNRRDLMETDRELRNTKSKASGDTGRKGRMMTSKSKTVSPTFFCSEEPSESPTGCINTVIALTTDGFGGETSWELIDSSATVIDSLLQGGQASLTTVSYDYCLDPDCYQWTIFDSFGDGICCLFGEGSYEIDFGGTIVARSTVGNNPFSGSSSQTEQFGVDCVRRLEETNSHLTFQYQSTVLDDDSTVNLELSVFATQEVSIVVVEIETGDTTELWDGTVIPGSPITVSFDTGNIFVAKYQLTISPEHGDSKTFTLAKVET